VSEKDQRRAAMNGWTTSPAQWQLLLLWVLAMLALSRSANAVSYVPQQAHRAMAMMSMATGVSASGPTATGIQTPSQ
jgi:hypothetical protein